LLTTYVGWLCAVTWQTGVAGSGYFVGALIQALFVLHLPNYHFERWHGTLFALAYLFVAIMFNTLLAKKLPMMEGIFVLIHILGIAILIPLWIMSPLGKGGSPIVDFYNVSGWSTTGIATMVGSLVPVTALIGFDCSVHMGMSRPLIFLGYFLLTPFFI